MRLCGFSAWARIPTTSRSAAGGTLLTWIGRGVNLDVRWVVFSAGGPRADEAGKSAEAFLPGATRAKIDAARVSRQLLSRIRATSSRIGSRP